MKKNNLFTALVVAGAVSLSACSGVKQELGIGRNSPDEFMVVKRAPLTLPPEYDLRPPDSGSVPPASEAAAQAKTALLGGSSEPVAKGKPEDAFLSKVGADKADPAIRQTINRENGIIDLQNQTLVDKLIFWKDEKDAANDESSVVNPKQEAERIKKNKEEGKPANEGEVPVIEKKRSTIDRLF